MEAIRESSVNISLSAENKGRNCARTRGVVKWIEVKGDELTTRHVVVKELTGQWTVTDARITRTTAISIILELAR